MLVVREGGVQLIVQRTCCQSDKSMLFRERSEDAPFEQLDAMEIRMVQVVLLAAILLSQAAFRLLGVQQS